jgi:hypothetical protein
MSREKKNEPDKKVDFSQSEETDKKEDVIIDSCKALLEKHPKGFIVDSTGKVGKVVFITHNLDVIFHRHPNIKGRGFYAVGEMEED